jgi:hypothetical protein
VTLSSSEAGPKKRYYPDDAQRIGSKEVIASSRGTLSITTVSIISWK